MTQPKKKLNKKQDKVPIKYKEKLVVNGTFEELMGALVSTKVIKKNKEENKEKKYH
ncbi:MAG: hypothetical protein Q8891_06765 [Bacteroidota bacterium]|nr:hypothetical protein [Bacteroidota bacterium]